MAFRATVYSPIQSSRFDRMPGVPATSNRYQSGHSSYPTTYSQKYNRYSGSSSSIGTGTSRPLPSGNGPLDFTGRRLSNYSVNDYSTKYNTLRSTPLKAVHNTDRNSNYSVRKYSPSTGGSSFTGGLHGRRSASISNLSEISGRSLTEKSPLSPTYQSQLETRSRSREFSKDGNNFSRTSSRSSRASISGLDNDRYDSSKNDTDNASDITKRLSDFRMGRENRTLSPVNPDSLSPIARRSSHETGSETQTKSLSRYNTLPAQGTSVSKHDKYSNSGKVGLRNLGNTCFMNSVLQCLSHTRPLLEYCLREDYLRDKNTTSNGMKGSLITAYANLMCSLWKDNNDTYVSPNAFKTQIQRFAPRFMGYSQQDAQEFLRYLLEGLHEDVNKITRKPKMVVLDDDQFNSDNEQSCEYWKNYLKFDNSRIVEIFVGQLKSVLKFCDCDHRSVTFDPFWDLSLPIPKGRSEVNITDCISHFMKEEALDDKPTCTKCKERRACTKGFSIQKFPRILVLHLKRFSQERYSRKISTHVEFPVTNLDMSEFAAEGVSQPAIYNLYAVSNHSGGTHSGHYTAYCKHPFLSDWNLFNDTRVSRVQSNQVTSAEAYVLFYELTNQPSHL